MTCRIIAWTTIKKTVYLSRYSANSFTIFQDQRILGLSITLSLKRRLRLPFLLKPCGFELKISLAGLLSSIHLINIRAIAIDTFPSLNYIHIILQINDFFIKSYSLYNVFTYVYPQIYEVKFSSYKTLFSYFGNFPTFGFILV